MSHIQLIKKENDLSLYHYTDDAQHPGNDDYWKGIVLDDKRVVACSYPWSQTVITENLPDDHIYTPLCEATILRFYRVDGKPMIGTHKQIDVSHRDSRVTASSKRFADLVKEAISVWEYKEYAYQTRDGRDAYAYTPSSWEDLCMEDWCHVFLLIDNSNQITDLLDLSVSHEMFDCKGNSDIVTFNHPRLIHAISFRVGTTPDDDGIIRMIPVYGEVTYDVPEDEHGYTQYSWIVPQLPTMSASQAQHIIDDGGAVVGFTYEHPTDTVKYLSYEYARKLDLAGDTFNPIHRWHQLMDEDPEDAIEYLNNLPYHMKHITLADVNDAYNRHTCTIVDTISNNIVARYSKRDASIDKRLYNKVKDIISEVLAELRNRYKRRPSDKQIMKDVRDMVLTRVQSLSYTDQHSLHGTIQRVSRQCT
jgi:hypothetical protein